MLFGISVYAFILIGLGCAAPSNLDRTRLVHQFPNETWVENIAVRGNGNLLVTLILPFAGLYEIDPSTRHSTPKLISNFTATNGLNSLTGISEDAPDVFYVAGSDFHQSTLETTPNSNFIFKIDFACSSCYNKPKISTLANVKNATLINGLNTPRPGLLFGADSKQGVVWGINTTTGAYHIAIDDPMFKIPSTRAHIGLGLNGIKTAGSKLYFTNSATSKFGKVNINTQGFATSSAVEIYDLTPDLPDDFALDEKAENAFVAAAKGHSLLRLNLMTARATTIAGNVNSTTLAEPTSAAVDRDVVYVSTAGGVAFPVNGDEIVGGQVVAVYLSRR